MTATSHRIAIRSLLALAISLSILLPTRSLAQPNISHYADSLLRHARQATSAAKKIEELLQVSIFWSTRDTAKAYQYLAEARAVMGTSPTPFQLGLYELYRGNILMEYQPLQAKKSFQTADSLLATDHSARSYYYRAKVWNNYGIVLQTEDKNAEFMRIVLRKALPYARRSGDSAAVAYQLQNIALQLENVSDYAGAQSYYRAALRTLGTSSDYPDTKLEIFAKAARVEIFLSNYTRAKSLLDSAARYAAAVPHSTYLPAYYCTRLIYFRHTKNTQKALANYKRGVASATQLGDQYMLMSLNYELHELYKASGDFQKSQYYLQRSRKYQPYISLKNIGLYHYEMAQLAYKMEDFRHAYFQMDTLTTILDSIYQKDLASKIRHWETQYATTQKQNHILRLQAANRKQELKIARSHWWELALAAGLLLAISIALFTWRIGKKNKKLLLQNKRLHEEELRSLHQRERLRHFDAMLQGQEAERGRLAKDLHDGLGGLLAGVKLKLSSVLAKEASGQSQPNGAMTDVMTQLDYSVEELRRIAHNMMPESLRYGGLASALSDLCRYMTTDQVQVIFQNLGLQNDYPEQFRITIYRIVQELLTNAVKHAQATKIILQCSELDHRLFLTVEDNGKGIKTAESQPQNGLGLANIRNRIALLQGDMETETRLGEGTTFNIQIPLDYDRTTDQCDHC